MKDENAGCRAATSWPRSVPVGAAGAAALAATATPGGAGHRQGGRDARREVADQA